jgi:hypothetical protein
MKMKLLGVALLAVMGVAKLPLEANLSRSLKEAQLLEASPDLNLRESLGQMGFAASLGGLRSLVASITYLQAYVAFEHSEWGKVDSLMTLTTRLQPKEVIYWDEAAWHMAYNAASGYTRDDTLRAAIKNKLFRDYVNRGLEIVQEGLVYLPEDPKLLVRMAEIYRDRKKEPGPAADAFLRAAKNGAKPFYERMAAYELVKVGEPEGLRQAYEILKRHFNNGFRYVSVVRDLDLLEKRLDIPAADRVGHTRPEASRRKKSP